MIKQVETLQAKRVKATKAAALVILFVLVSLAPWSKKNVNPQISAYRMEVSR
jgi:hypothetical protein